MNLENRKTFAKSFSTTEVTQQQLTELCEKHNFLSDSEAMRRAVAEFHKMTFPDYIYKKSAKDMKARADATEALKIDEMDATSYANTYIGNVLAVDSTDGHKYILVHGLSNMLSAIRDDKIKAYVTDYPDLVELHQKKSNNITVESQLSDYMVQLLHKQYGIIIPEKVSNEETK